MKKFKALMLCLIAMFLFAACSDQNPNSGNSSSTVNNSGTDSAQHSVSASTDTQNSTEDWQETPEPPANTEGNRILVAYFAYAENIGDTSGMSVDAITSASVGRTSNTNGNLQVMAQVIQETKGADVFHIVVQNPYNPEYDIMHDRAIEEIDNAAFPALTGKIENLDQYDVVYLGMPVWSSSLPRPVATFLIENDLSGKTIIPFGIHLGSRFGKMLGEIEALCPTADLIEGYTVNAGSSNDSVKSEFTQWLAGLE